MSEVDSYILQFGPQVQSRLVFIRKTAWQSFGEAGERLYHKLPSLFQNGHSFLSYGAYKNHIAICVGYNLTHFLKSQYPQFKYTKSTITFPHSEPFPEEIVRTICHLLKQELAKGILPT